MTTSLVLLENEKAVKQESYWSHDRYREELSIKRADLGKMRDGADECYRDKP